MASRVLCPEAKYWGVLRGQHLRNQVLCSVEGRNPHFIPLIVPSYSQLR